MIWRNGTISLKSDLSQSQFFRSRIQTIGVFVRNPRLTTNKQILDSSLPFDECKSCFLLTLELLSPSSLWDPLRTHRLSSPTMPPKRMSTQKYVIPDSLSVSGTKLKLITKLDLFLLNLFLRFAYIAVRRCFAVISSGCD